MRVLVTGGAGFIGSHLAEAFLAEGHEVAAVDNLSSGRPENVPPGVRLHNVDILSDDLARVFEVFRPEVVTHHAAQSSVKISTRDPMFDLAINGGGTANVAALCVRHGVQKLIYASSGGTLYGIPETNPVPETAPIQPVSPYGTSKRVGEEYIQLAARTEGLPATILRYGNVYGPRQDPHGEAGVVAIFTGLMLDGETCTIDGDGEQKKDYCYVGDVARANVLAASAAAGTALNIGSGEATSVNAIYEALSRHTGNTVAAKHGPPREGDVRHFALDTTRAEAELGWQPQVSFDEGLRLTVESFRAARASG